MSFEDYVEHITRKYQVAVAIAVIKNKPENLTTDQYIVQLQEKIQMNSMEMYDLNTNDFDLKDSDFNFEDDGEDSLLASGLNKSFGREIPDGTNETENVNIIDGFNITQIDDAASMNLLEEYNMVLECARINDTNAGEEVINKDSSNSNTSTDDVLNTLREIDENMQVDNNHLSYSFSPFTICDNSKSIENIVDVNMVILEDLPRINFDISNTATNTQKSVVDERIKANVLKNLNKDTKGKDVKHITEEINNVKNNEASIRCHNFNQCMTNTQRVRETEIALKEIRDESTTQKTLIPQSYSAKDTNNTVHITEEINNVKNNEASIRCHNFNQCMTNTQRVREIEIALKEIRDESTTQKILLLQSHSAKDTNNTVNEIMRNPVTEKENINQNNDLDNLTEEVITERNIELDPILDTQATELYTLQEFTENNTQISQSQCQNVEISKNLLFGNKVRDNAIRINNNCNQNEDDRTQTAPAQINIVYSQDNTKTQNPGIITGPIQYIIDQSGKKYTVIQTMPLTNTIQTANINNTMDVDDETCTDTEICGKNIDPCTAREETTTQFEHDKDSEDEIQASGSQEVIPFKVIKELSKVKTFLNQTDRTVSTDGCSLDSGYKSDTRSSFKAAQPALVCEIWPHQSAHSLYSYVVQCPLVGVTHDIVTEISQVLGKLIDRLHREEKYPAFLEELLDKVDCFLRELYLGDSNCDNNLLEKDEIIQRILMLNKSTHILKFTIDKITTILDELHKNLTATDNLYELTSIGEIENISYIFFILEILIQKYIKNKNNINLSQSQTALNSQEAKTFKKSSISEIWRKKWNPSGSKELKNVGSQEKSCVLLKCAEVLNKVIVECMEGYSLVSFRALQCFNLLQNQ